MRDAGSRSPFAANAASSRLPELAGGRPLVGGADGPEDLERDAVLAERLDALDARRLEDASLPDRVVVHRPADRVDDLDRVVDVRAVGDA